MPRPLSNRRRYGTRPERRVIHIYSEGTVTEPTYFYGIKKELRLTQIDIKPEGTSRSTLALVELVLNKKDGNTQDEFWVVFDRDEHSDFNKAIEVAEANGISVAYSNACFELWFILHFEYLQNALERGHLSNRLTKLLHSKYFKNMDIYPVIKGREHVAIKNAKKLEAMHDRTNTNSYQERSPSTTVYKLVEYLRSLN